MFFPDLAFIPALLPVPGKPEVNFAPFPGCCYSGITPLVSECSPDRTYTGAPSTEIAFPLRIVRSGCESGAVSLTFPAVDAGI